MLKSSEIINGSLPKPDWVTIQEAVNIINTESNERIKESDIYRYALYNKINLAIYFQSPIILRKIKYAFQKVKMHPARGTLIHRLCLLEKNSFINGWDSIFSTEGRYVHSTQNIIDTSLIGFECILIKQFLACSLNIPLPIIGKNTVNYGITVTMSNEVFQLFEKTTWKCRIEHQIKNLPTDLAFDIMERISSEGTINQNTKQEYFPLYNFPQDSCFVIRYSEIEKLISTQVTEKSLPSSTRISTPLSRLFWLACRHNDVISPLIKQPYKLLTIFEEWAAADGITDRLSGDTLKTALERGSPPSSSLLN
ncbi:hypothetical protein [Escherichia coli]|uniref:hypothetical protein n=1 Tax=Escherichia coli TaxID=562 RepID=UPI001F0D7BCF|nr:hypothetical protein [Escherichia coli]UMV98514.1 hypothetical protein L6L66_13095 [Escherichia coli]